MITVSINSKANSTFYVVLTENVIGGRIETPKIHWHFSSKLVMTFKFQIRHKYVTATHIGISVQNWQFQIRHKYVTATQSELIVQVLLILGTAQLFFGITSLFFDKNCLKYSYR